MAQPRVLSVSCDQQLLVARHKLLEHAGFNVTSLADTFEALALLEEQPFDVVVVGHSFSFTEKQLFAAEVGERWRTPVVVLYDAIADFRPTADAEIEITEGAAELVATLKSLIQRRRKRSA